MSVAMIRDPAAYARPVHSGRFPQVVAGGGANGVMQYGPWLDVRGQEAAVFLAIYKAVLAATKSISLTLKVQDAVDLAGTGAADVDGMLVGPNVLYLAAANITYDGVYEWGVRLAGTRGYVRLGIATTLSNTATDTADVTAVLDMGAARRNPS